MNDERLKKTSRINSFFIDTFKELIRFVLALLALGLIMILPFVLIPISIASFVSGKWLGGLGYLFLGIVGFYFVRGLGEVIKNHDK